MERAELIEIAADRLIAQVDYMESRFAGTCALSDIEPLAYGIVDRIAEDHGVRLEVVATDDDGVVFQ